MSTLAERLIEDFADKDFAHGYMEDHGNAVIAAQIRALREQRGLSQKALAELAGMKQASISRLEDVDYDAWTVKTLRKLAEAFDVHLKVAFAPFSESILDVTNLNRDALQVRPREEDLAAFREHHLCKRDGQWRAIPRNHLATVKPIASSSPVDPSRGGWQTLQRCHG
jgi:transcriptional regulator with XRE-family HTH domain